MCSPTHANHPWPSVCTCNCSQHTYHRALVSSHTVCTGATQQVGGTVFSLHGGQSLDTQAVLGGVLPSEGCWPCSSLFCRLAKITVTRNYTVKDSAPASISSHAPSVTPTSLPALEIDSFVKICFVGICPFGCCWKCPSSLLPYPARGSRGNSPPAPGTITVSQPGLLPLCTHLLTLGPGAVL